MPKPDVGHSIVGGRAGDTFQLQLSRSRGAVIAVAFRLTEVAAPPKPKDAHAWVESDFLTSPLQAHNLPALGAGRYEAAVVVSLMPPNTELQSELFQNGTLIYRRTVINGENKIRSISLRIS